MEASGGLYLVFPAMMSMAYGLTKRMKVAFMPVFYKRFLIYEQNIWTMMIMMITTTTQHSSPLLGQRPALSMTVKPTIKSFDNPATHSSMTPRASMTGGWKGSTRSNFITKSKEHCTTPNVPGE